MNFRPTRDLRLWSRGDGRWLPGLLLWTGATCWSSEKPRCCSDPIRRRAANQAGCRPPRRDHGGGVPRPDGFPHHHTDETIRVRFASLQIWWKAFQELSSTRGRPRRRLGCAVSWTTPCAGCKFPEASSLILWDPPLFPSLLRKRFLYRFYLGQVGPF